MTVSGKIGPSFDSYGHSYVKNDQKIFLPWIFNIQYDPKWTKIGSNFVLLGPKWTKKGFRIRQARVIETPG